MSCCASIPHMPPIPRPRPHPPFAGDPPIVPYRETIADDGGAFKHECVSQLKTMPDHLAWTWGDQLLTEAPNGALVWRGDYTTPRDGNAKRINRVICSVLPSGALDMQIAVDQPIERLSIAARELEDPK